MDIGWELVEAGECFPGKRKAPEERENFKNSEERVHEGTESWREWEGVETVTKKGGCHFWNEGERRFKQLIAMCISVDIFITCAQILSQILQKPAYFFSNL